MASLGGTTSGSSSLQQNSGSEEEMQMQIMDEKKRKRMESNRESARKSRMKKQKHLDELMARVSDLRKTNNQLISSINMTRQHYLKFEAENSVLRAQMSDLSNRLESLNEISNVLSVVNSNNHNLGFYEAGDKMEELYPIFQEPFQTDSFLMNSWNSTPSLNNPIMASANMFQF